jgi:hypothetical protein
MKTQDRQSLVANLLREKAGTQGLRRPRFPFFQSQCQRAGGNWQMPPPEPPMEANLPSGVNDRRSVTRAYSGLAPLLSEDRAVAYNPAGSGKRPARRGYLSSDPLLVKGRVTVSGRFRFRGDCDLRATFLPECAATLVS